MGGSKGKKDKEDSGDESAKKKNKKGAGSDESSSSSEEVADEVADEGDGEGGDEERNLGKSSSSGRTSRSRSSSISKAKKRKKEAKKASKNAGAGEKGKTAASKEAAREEAGAAVRSEEDTFNFANVLDKLMEVFLVKKNAKPKGKGTGAAVEAGPKRSRKAQKDMTDNIKSREVPTVPFLAFIFTALNFFPVDLSWEKVKSAFLSALGVGGARLPAVLPKHIFKPDVFAEESRHCRSPRCDSGVEGALMVEEGTDCNSEDESHDRLHFGGDCELRLDVVLQWLHGHFRELIPVKALLLVYQGGVAAQQLVSPPRLKPYYSFDPNNLKTEGFPLEELRAVIARYFRGKEPNAAKLNVLVPSTDNPLSFRTVVVSNVSFIVLLEAFVLSVRRSKNARYAPPVHVVFSPNQISAEAFAAMREEARWCPIPHYALSNIVPTSSSSESLLDLWTGAGIVEIGAAPVAFFAPPDSGRIIFRVSSNGLGGFVFSSLMTEPDVKVKISYKPMKPLDSVKTKTSSLLSEFELRVNVPVGYSVTNSTYIMGTLLNGKPDRVGLEIVLEKVAPRVIAPLEEDNFEVQQDGGAERDHGAGGGGVDGVGGAGGGVALAGGGGDGARAGRRRGATGAVRPRRDCAQGASAQGCAATRPGRVRAKNFRSHCSGCGLRAAGGRKTSRENRVEHPSCKVCRGDPTFARSCGAHGGGRSGERRRRRGSAEPH